MYRNVTSKQFSFYLAKLQKKGRWRLRRNSESLRFTIHICQGDILMCFVKEGVLETSLELLFELVQPHWQVGVSCHLGEFITHQQAKRCCTL